MFGQFRWLPSSLSDVSSEVFQEAIATGDQMKHNVPLNKIPQIDGNLWDNNSTRGLVVFRPFYAEFLHII